MLLKNFALCFTVLIGLGLFFCGIATAQNAWTQFRGPDGSGESENDSLSLIVDPKVDAKWRTSVPGSGWSTPVTDGNVIWMTAARVTEATAEQRAAALADVQLADMKDVAGSVRLLAIALNATTGSLEHTIDLGTVKQPKPIHPMNGYASPTPVIVGDRVIVDFGQYGTWGLDKNTGKQLWHRTIVVDDSVGPGSSPIAHGGLVILTRDGMDKQFVEAVSVADGKTAWKTDRPPLETSNPEFRKSYSTPLLMKVGGTTQAIIPGSQWCVSYDAISGEELWRFEHGSGFSVTPMPSRIGDNIVFSTGFMRAELIAIDPTGRGDVTESHVAWRIGKGGSRMSSMVQDGDRLYSISDDGILTVVRNDDGGTVYRKRLGGKFSASPFRVGNRIWIANHDGEVTVFEAGDEFRTVADYTFDEQIMASPVVNGNDLLIRTAEAVYCFGGK